MLITPEQVRAARALLRLDQDELARRASVSVATIRRVKAAFPIVPHGGDLAATAREAFLSFGNGRHPAALKFGDCASYALAKATA